MWARARIYWQIARCRRPLEAALSAGDQTATDRVTARISDLYDELLVLRGRKKDR